MREICTSGSEEGLAGATQSVYSPLRSAGTSMCQTVHTGITPSLCVLLQFDVLVRVENFKKQKTKSKNQKKKIKSKKQMQKIEAKIKNRKKNKSKKKQK